MAKLGELTVKIRAIGMDKYPGTKTPPLAIVEHQRDKALADYEQAMHRVSKLEAAMTSIRAVLQKANEDGQITDTLWMPESESFSETLFDYIDSMIQ